MSRSLKFLFCFLTVVTSAYAQSDHILSYDKPAQYFEESLPLGNGKAGACVFGGVETEKIFLNDITLWSGEPVNAEMNPDAHKHLPGIRAALQNENYKLADSLNKNLQGKFSESYAPLGTLFISMKHVGKEADYKRELDISRAISKVQYTIEGVRYTREYFVSHPDQVMVIRLTSSKKGGLTFDLSFESLLKFKSSVVENIFKVDGYAPIHAEPSYRGDMPNAVVFDPERGTRFSTRIRIDNKDGKI